MRQLTQEETCFLDDNGESEEGAIPVCITIQELADMGAGTSCGMVGNTCFKTLAEKGFGHRKCYGWLLENPKKSALLVASNTGLSMDDKNRLQRYAEEQSEQSEIMGMFHIKIQTDKTAERIERIAGEAGGSLRFDGDSELEGFKVFEIE